MAKPSKQNRIKQNSTASSWPDWTKYLLIVFVFFVYGKTLNYGFVLDDDLFVKNSPVVQSGFKGLPAAFYQESLHHFKGSNFQIYRPAMISLFAIEKGLFGFNPKAYHLINLFLYALICMAFFSLIRALFRQLDARYAFICSLLFLVHPVHSEVVANIKSQDELLAALGCLLSLRYGIRYFDGDTLKKKLLVQSILCYTLALFSKESSAVFFGVFPLTFFLLRNNSMLRSIRLSLPYLAAAVGFIACRFFVLRGLVQEYETSVIENVLYGVHGVGEATATRAAILFMYWYKLFWPANLSWDYSFNQIPVTGWTGLTPFLSVGLYLIAILTAVYFFNKKKMITWGIAFFILLILPTSNILFLNGTTFAERFLFLPSAGIIISCIPFLVWMSGSGENVFNSSGKSRMWVMVVPIVLLATFATMNRCADWKDNFTLFESASISTPQSSRVQAGLATEYMNKAENTSVQEQRLKFVGLAQEHFKKALDIFPGNSNAAYRLGLIYALTNDTARAINYYRNAIASKPDFVYALTNLSAVYASKLQYDSALYFLDRSFTADSLNSMTLTNLVVIHSIRGEDSLVLRYAEVAERNNLMSEKIIAIRNESSARLK